MVITSAGSRDLGRKVRNRRSVFMEEVWPSALMPRPHPLALAAQFSAAISALDRPRRSCRWTSQNPDAFALPGGSNAQRPTGGALVNGEIRYNTAGTGQIEAYYNGAWNSLVTSATAGTSTPAAGSTGQVQFNSGGDLAASSNFYWDNTNGRLGIGSTSPTYPLDINAWSARVRATGQSTSDADFIASNTSGNSYLGVDNAAGTVMGLGEAYGRFIYSSGAYPLMFLTNGSN